MNDKEWNKKKNKVRLLIRKWINDLGLRWYDIDINYKAGDAPDREEGYSCAAQVVSKWMYRTATIDIWLEIVPEDQQKLEKLVVHELCHILVAQMRHDGIVGDNEECVVEGLARAFLWVKDAGREEKKK